MASRRAFFFPHARRPGTAPPEPPGRVPFNVTATVTDGVTSWSSPAIIFADGYAPNTVGPNQDPCVLAAPQPFHSFCRINNNKSDNCVRHTARSLSASVHSGDLIFYSKFEPPSGPGPTTRVWIDTVLVVDRVVQWPTLRRPRGERCSNPLCKRHEFTLRDPAGFAALLTGESNGAESDAYRYNLRDAESDGFHCCTPLTDYGVIVGVADGKAASLTALTTSFAPLAASSSEGELEPVSVGATDLGDDWAKVAQFFDSVVRAVGRGPHGSWIAEFPERDLADVLCQAIVAASALNGQQGIVALLPVFPTSAPHRVTGSLTK